MSNTTAADAFPPPPPPGLNYIAVVQSSLNALMIGTVWSAMLVPLLLTLFVFSTRELRRKPIFLLSVCAILLGLGEGSLNCYMMVQLMLRPLEPMSPAFVMAFGALEIMIPILVESILVVRLLAVYPPARSSWARIFIVFGPLVLIKIGRLVNVSVGLAQMWAIVRSIDNPLEAGQAQWRRHPAMQIEWIFQIVDNMYSSALFLWRLRYGSKLAKESNVNRTSSHLSKLRTLFWISVSNFVFPVFLSLAQVIFANVDNDYSLAAYVFMTNNYVEIIGVLLATVWTAGSNWTEHKTQHNSSSAISTMLFRRKKPRKDISTLGSVTVTKTEFTLGDNESTTSHIQLHEFGGSVTDMKKPTPAINI